MNKHVLIRNKDEYDRAMRVVAGMSAFVYGVNYYDAHRQFKKLSVSGEVLVLHTRYPIGVSTLDSSIGMYNCGRKSVYISVSEYERQFDRNVSIVRESGLLINCYACNKTNESLVVVEDVLEDSCVNGSIQHNLYVMDVTSNIKSCVSVNDLRKLTYDEFRHVNAFTYEERAEYKCDIIGCDMINPRIVNALSGHPSFLPDYNRCYVMKGDIIYVNVD